MGHGSMYDLRRRTTTYVDVRRRMSSYVDVRRRHFLPLSHLECPAFTSCVKVRRRKSTYVDVRRRTSTYVHVRRRTSTYVEVRRRTSTYVDQIFEVSFVAAGSFETACNHNVEVWATALLPHLKPLHLPITVLEIDFTKGAGAIPLDRKVLDGAVPHGADEKNKKYKKVLTP